MDALLGTLSILGFLVCTIMVIVSAVKKSGKAKKWAIGSGICFVLFIVAVSMSDTTSKTASTSTAQTTTSVVQTKTAEQIEQEKVATEQKAKQVADAKATAAAQELANLKSEARFIPYKDLARNPDSYKGVKVTYTGQVIQVQESGNSVALRVNITKNEYDFYEDTVFIQYDKNIISSRVLEDDVITFWGTANGLLTYTTIMGSELSIPQINVQILQIN